MSSAGINFSGLASGLDTKSIISALMALEKRPITALETKKTSLQGQKRLFGDFSSLLGDLQKTVKALSRTSDFLKMKASSSDENLLTASAGNTATPGSHELVVNTLARAQLNLSGRYADKDQTQFGTGTLLLTIDGQTHGIDIGGQGSSLQNIADTINAQADAQDFGVAAQVVDTGGTGSNRYQLVLRSTTAGSAGAFTLTADSASGALDTLVDDLNATGSSDHGARAATDASITLDGVTLTRPTNSIADVIAGVTIDLKNADPTKTVTVAVATDATETSKAVSDFVDAYNKVVAFVAGQNVVGQDGSASSPLFGDGTLRSIRSTLRNLTGAQVATGNDAFSLFSQVGITADRDGKLTFNQGKFEESLGQDEQAVRALFAGTTVGIATRMNAQIDVFTSSTDGLIKARQDGYDRLIKDTQTRIDQGNERLAKTQAALEQRYANLESLLSQLQSQGSALSSLKTATG